MKLIFHIQIVMIDFTFKIIIYLMFVEILKYPQLIHTDSIHIFSICILCNLKNIVIFMIQEM